MRTISTTTALVKLKHRQIAGRVLTSSTVNAKTVDAVPKQALDFTKPPVLVYRHQGDAFKLFQPREVPVILAGLKNAPIMKLMSVAGGSNPTPAQSFRRCTGTAWSAWCRKRFPASRSELESL